MCEYIDGGMPPLPNAATPAAAEECKVESTSIGAGPTFSKYLGFIGLTMEWATAATPCRSTRAEGNAVAGSDEMGHDNNGAVVKTPKQWRHNVQLQYHRARDAVKHKES